MNTKISILIRGLITVFILMGLSSTSVFAQAVERIYAANSCNTLDYGQNANEGTWDYLQSNDQSLDAGAAGGDAEFDLVCPIVRQKVGSASGAKFFVYVDDMGASDEFECTMTSRRPHNGALVSSGTRLRTAAQANANEEVTLARSISPSSTYGHYSLECTTDNLNPRIHSYRIREF